MSRSRSPENSPDVPPARRMSISSNHSRPSTDEVPAKRARNDSRQEDKVRGKRLFGNILGTLNKFKKEDKSSRTSEAAKRREQVSERIATKIRSESNLHHDIQEAERELKTLRIQTDSTEAILKQKEIAMNARHANMKPISRFLHTSLPPSAPPLINGGLLNPSPIPLNQGPSRGPPHPKQLKPLYFLPKILVPEQEAELKSTTANIDELISEEVASLEKERKEAAETASRNKERISELSSKLSELRKQVKPLEIKGRASNGQTDELGRERRPTEDEKMEVDDEQDREREQERNEKEKGVQIRGDDGDVEVEY